MLGFTRWLGPMLRSKMGSALTRPLGWKIIDAHERLRESENKESAPTNAAVGDERQTVGGQTNKMTKE